MFVFIGAALMVLAGANLEAAKAGRKPHASQLQRAKELFEKKHHHHDHDSDSSSDSDSDKEHKKHHHHHAASVPVTPSGASVVAPTKTDNIVGVAYGAQDSDPAVRLPVLPLTSNSTYLAPLYHGTPRTDKGVPFTFVPYVSNADPLHADKGYFEIHEEGRYLLQYGMTARANGNFANDLMRVNAQLLATAWMAIQVEDVYGTKTLVGPVPLSLSHSKITCALCTLCSGFGQIPVDLKVGDKVSIQIYVAMNQPDKDLFVMRIEDVTFPHSGDKQLKLSRGPTLRIEKIADDGNPF